MRFAHQRISPNKQHNSTKCLQHTQNVQINTRLQSERTYVHYNNCIYMGGVTSYKRNGQGIMLLDDGSSIISEYCFDSMTGHNVIFRENCIISVLFLKNGMFQVVLRTGQCVIKVPYYEKDDLPNGNGVLVDYQTMKIYHILFQYGRITKKIVESNKKIIEQVMRQELRAIMDQRHEYALKINLKFNNGIKILKEGKKITIGYVDKRQHIEGIGFKLKVNENTYDDFAFPFEMKCIQRGFYMRNRLQNFGERYFSNGNLYIGQFEDDLFNGQGLLLYPHEEKWVFGVFEGQKLKKMININLGDGDTSKPQTIKSCLKEIHEFNTKNWIGTDIFIFDWDKLKELFREVFNTKVTDIVIEKERAQRQQQERLGKIQEHFSSELPGNGINKVMEQQMVRNQRSPEKVVFGDYGSLKAKVIEIQPRNAENEDYWSSALPLPTYDRKSPSKILTPSHSNWKIQDFRRTQSKFTTISRTPKASYSPYKRFNYPTNTLID